MKSNKMSKILAVITILCLFAIIANVLAPRAFANDSANAIEPVVESTAAATSVNVNVVRDNQPHYLHERCENTAVDVEAVPEATEPEYEPVVFGEEITFTSEYVKDEGVMPYLMYTPSTANDGGDIPLIVWLHGSGEKNVAPSWFECVGLPAVLNNWTLEGFNAYVICPQLTGEWNPGYWSCDISVNNVRNLIDRFVETHNVNTDKIIITGHSLGGQGSLYMALNMPEYFSKLAVLSGYPINGDVSEIQIPTVGYVENTGTSYSFMSGTFAPVFGDDVTTVYSAAHGAIPQVAMTEDKDGNNRSDLIEWMLEA